MFFTLLLLLLFPFISFSYLWQLIFEGMAGLSDTADIAVDDISFSNNLTCDTVGKPTPPYMFEGKQIFSRYFYLSGKI